MYYKYTRTITGGWRKEEIKEKVYPVKIGDFDLIIVKDKYCWNIRDAKTWMGLVTGYAPSFKTRKGVITAAEKMLNDIPEQRKKTALLYSAEYAIKFSKLPVNEDIQNISDYLTQEDYEKISALYN